VATVAARELDIVVVLGERLVARHGAGSQHDLDDGDHHALGRGLVGVLHHALLVRVAQARLQSCESSSRAAADNKRELFGSHAAVSHVPSMTRSLPCSSTCSKWLAIEKSSRPHVKHSSVRWSGRANVSNWLACQPIWMLGSDFGSVMSSPFVLPTACLVARAGYARPKPGGSPSILSTALVSAATAAGILSRAALSRALVTEGARCRGLSLIRVHGNAP